MKIVVRTPNWIGDVIFALPALESLTANYPEAEIRLAAGGRVKEIFEGEEFAGRLIPLPLSNTFKNFRESAKILKGEGFDIGLLLANSFSSAFLFAAAKIPQRWGYKRDGRGLFLTKGVHPGDEDPPVHMVHYYLRLLEGLDLKTLPPEIRITVSAEEKEKARRELAAAGADPKKPLVILNPGAAYGPAKRWPASGFAELARLLQERKSMDIAITGAPEDAALGAEIASGLARKPIDLVGKTTLRGLFGVISRASVFITNDTGPMHMANALRVPVVGIFGPTDPRVTGPFHPPATVIRKEEIPCRPCSYRQCPYDHRCLRRIPAEEVYDAAAAYLP
ncbi:MAG: lipopolysaccharide heptosyltransferase II [Candidatus Aminicenantales bacterium]